jgi:hypothetical protein
MAKYQYGLYTDEQDSWLRENATGRKWAQLADQFNEVFGTAKSENALKQRFSLLKKPKKAECRSDVECCQACVHAYKGGTCSVYKSCAAWRKWFKAEWRIIRALANKEKLK